MDRYYLNELIRRVEQEKSVHDSKFAGNACHANCLPRFDGVIEKLRLALAKVDEATERESQSEP